MTRTLTCLSVVLIGLLLTRRAQAEPTFGPSCINCHAARTGTLSVSGNTGTLNLDGKRLDGKKPGALKLFVVGRGKTIPISIRVSNASSRFDVDTFFASNRGLKNSKTNKLSYTADPKWFKTGSPAYYLLSRSAVPFTKSTTYVYNLKVSATAPLDVYEMYINIGGTGGGRWAQQRRIYVKVVK